MSAALTPPLLVAAGVLCLAGALKLRSPAPAERALSILGLHATPIIVRSFATVEIALGGWAISAGRAAAAASAAALTPPRTTFRSPQRVTAELGRVERIERDVDAPDPAIDKPRAKRASCEPLVVDRHLIERPATDDETGHRTATSHCV